MKRTLYKALMFWALVFGIVTADKSECRASEVVSISSNTVVRDCLETGSDTNYYAYVADTTGYITIDFKREDPASDAGMGWDMYIYDDAQNELCAYRQIKESVSTQKLNFGPGTKLYMKICANDEHFPPQDGLYSIRVTAVAKSNWEMETGKFATDKWETRIHNSSELTAEKRYGSLWTGTDNDVYKIRVAGTGVVTLRFWPNNVRDNVGWGYDIEIYKKNGFKATEFKQIKKTVKKTFYAKKGIYYVVVKANWANSAPPATDDYAIAATSKVTAVPSMKGRKVSYVAKTSTLKWKKAKNVDGYEIQICKNKKFKKKKIMVYTTVEKSYRLSKSMSKGTYYVRIRAYCDTVTGNRLYGKFSKVKKIIKK